jgi:hypothetical protein
MKIRTAFVSNSSSSSFCLFGVKTDIEELQAVFKEDFACKQVAGCEHDFDRTDNKYCCECGKPAFIEYKPNIYDILGGYGYGIQRTNYGEFVVGLNVAGKRFNQDDFIKTNSEFIDRYFGRTATFIVGESR